MIFLASQQTDSNIYMKGQIAYCSQNTLKEDKVSDFLNHITWLLQCFHN